MIFGKTIRKIGKQLIYWQIFCSFSLIQLLPFPSPKHVYGKRIDNEWDIFKKFSIFVTIFLFLRKKMLQSELTFFCEGCVWLKRPKKSSSFYYSYYTLTFIRSPAANRGLRSLLFDPEQRAQQRSFCKKVHFLIQAINVTRI